MPFFVVITSAITLGRYDFLLLLQIRLEHLQLVKRSILRQVQFETVRRSLMHCKLHCSKKQLQALGFYPLNDLRVEEGHGAALLDRVGQFSADRWALTSADPRIP